MPIVDLPVYGGSYATKSKLFSSQRWVNMYYSPAQGAALSDGMAVGVEGVSQVATAGDFRYPSRGCLVMDGIPYRVQGGTLQRQNADDTLTNLGVIAGEERVSLATNGTQLMVVNELGNGYIYDKDTSLLTAISSTAFTGDNGKPLSVCYASGYFVCPTDEKKFIGSAIDDGLSWNALDFSRADGDPDKIVSDLSFRGQLYMLGETTTEGFQNVGGADFPWAKNGILINKGLSFRHAVVVTSDAFFWLGAGVGETPAIWFSTGQDAKKVSTDAEDFFIRGELTKEGIENTFAFSYSLDGSYFVGFTFPSKTIVFNITSQRWFERESLIDGLAYRWRANCLCQAYGSIYIGDFKDGRIGKLDDSLFTEYDGLLVSKWIGQPFYNSGKPIFIISVKVTCEAGVGNALSTDPKIRLAFSTDGRTEGYERERSLGKVGEYHRITKWNRCGRFDHIVMLILTMSDKAKRMILKIEADIR